MSPLPAQMQSVGLGRHDPPQARGVKHLRIYGKGEKLRNVRLPPASLDRITEYLGAAGHGALPSTSLFKPVRNNRCGTTDTALTADGVYQILKFYGQKVGVSVDRFGRHSAHATGGQRRKRSF